MAITKLNSLAIPPDTVVESDISFPLDSASFTGDLTVDTDTLVVDSTNNRVGIGVAIPSRALQVEGDADSSSSISLNRTGALARETRIGSNYVGSFTDNDFYVYANSEIAITAKSDGNVGINKSNPLNPLHVGSDATTVAQRISTNISSTEGNVDFLQAYTINGVCSALNLIREGSTKTGLAFKTTDAGTLTTQMTIDSVGKVGIGTPSPDAQMHVSGGINSGPASAGSTDASIIVSNADKNYGIHMNVSGATGTGFISAQRNDGTATTYPLSLNPNGGNVGIGATDPDSKLDVRGTILGGASSPSTGQIAFGVQYHGTTNIANTYGTMKSSAATCIGWGVYGSPAVTEGFVSSVDTSLNFRRGALLVDQDELRFFNAGQQTVARDAAVTMTERFKVDANGRLMLNIASSSIQAPLRGQAFGSTSSYFGYYFDASGTVLSYVRGDGLFSTGNGPLAPYSFSVTGRDVYVNSTGQLGYVSSIREAKENIQPIEDVSWL